MIAVELFVPIWENQINFGNTIHGLKAKY